MLASFGLYSCEESALKFNMLKIIQNISFATEKASHFLENDLMIALVM